MAEMLRINDLHAYYGESHILHGVDMHVNEGEVVTLVDAALEDAGGKVAVG